MNAIGIVAEFNPFHSGHSYLISSIKNEFTDPIIVAVMSGNFVQRGEAAFEDKWTRSRIAVEKGVDLVVQLPTRFSNASSFFFAYGAMDILKSLSVETVAFGSESGDICRLRAIASFLAENFDDVNKYAASRTKDGISFPKAREEYLEKFFHNTELSRNFTYDKNDVDDVNGESENENAFAFRPNEILALDYIIAGTLLGYRGDYFSVKRSGEGHSESASKIRKEFYRENPDKQDFYEESLYNMVLGKLSTHQIEKPKRDGSEGSYFVEEELFNRLVKRWRYTDSLASLEDELVSKIHTRARVRRFLISYVLGNEMLSKEEMLSKNAIYPLAFNKKGAEYLKYIKNNGKSRLAFLSKISPSDSYCDGCCGFDAIADEEIVATDVYNLLRDNPLYDSCEYVKRPIMVHSNMQGSDEDA